MIQRSVTISNKLGLHARASAKLTKLAGSYPCNVFMTRGERRVNAKSIMGVMMLAAGLGTEVMLETSGEQEQVNRHAQRWLAGLLARAECRSRILKVGWADPGYRKGPGRGPGPASKRLPKGPRAPCVSPTTGRTAAELLLCAPRLLTRLR